MFFPKICQQRCTLDLINTQCRNRISSFLFNLIYTFLFSKVIEHLFCLHIPAVHWAAGARNLPTITLMLFPNWCTGCSIQQMSFCSCWLVTFKIPPRYTEFNMFLFIHPDESDHIYFPFISHRFTFVGRQGHLLCYVFAKDVCNEDPTDHSPNSFPVQTFLSLPFVSLVLSTGVP